MRPGIGRCSPRYSDRSWRCIHRMASIVMPGTLLSGRSAMVPSTADHDRRAGLDLHACSVRPRHQGRPLSTGWSTASCPPGARSRSTLGSRCRPRRRSFFVEPRDAFTSGWAWARTAARPGRPAQVAHHVGESPARCVGRLGEQGAVTFSTSAMARPKGNLREHHRLVNRRMTRVSLRHPAREQRSRATLAGQGNRAAWSSPPADPARAMDLVSDEVQGAELVVHAPASPVGRQVADFVCGRASPLEPLHDGSRRRP